MGRFKAVQRYHILLASNFDGEMFVTSFENLVGSIVWFLQRFLHSVTSDVYVCGRRQFIVNVSLPC